MPNNNTLPDGLIAYGPNANCTIEICPLSASVYGYFPTLGGNAAFIALFGIVLIIQLVLGWKWRSWFFMGAMALGCIDEMIGYGGRIMLHKNPFTFVGFLIQIICITIGPVFYCAAIYVTLTRIVLHLGSSLSRLPPHFFYWFFIPCDVASLALQAAGGALSSTSSGSNKNGVDIALAGLSFQVFTLCVFISLALDYVFRWRRACKATGSGLVDGEGRPITGRFKMFAAFLVLAIVLILIRCAYRIDELSDGYNGPLIGNQGLFIGLEGVMVLAAAFALCVAHPGLVWGRGGAGVGKSREMEKQEGRV